MTPSPVQRLAGIIGVPAGYIEGRDGTLDVRRLYETLCAIGRGPNNTETVTQTLSRNYGPEAASLAWECFAPRRKQEPKTKGTEE